jgi:hypothetical protein
LEKVLPYMASQRTEAKKRLELRSNLISSCGMEIDPYYLLSEDVELNEHETTDEDNISG